MAASLPYPDKPANGQAPDATPILANLLALLSAIQSFDGSQVQAGTIKETAFADAVNPRLRDGAWMANFVESGGWTSAFTALTWVMPSGYAWTNGYRSLFTGQNFTVAASSDTYYSVTQAGALNTPLAVANGAAQPSLPAGSQWLAKVVSNASSITLITDLRNRYPVNAGSLVQSQANSGTAGGTMYYINLGGMKLLWAAGNVQTTGANSGAAFTFTLPVGFFSAVTVVLNGAVSSGDARGYSTTQNANATSIGIFVDNPTASAGIGAAPSFLAIGV